MAWDWERTGTPRWDWCAFLAGLHDLGKASPDFQLQVGKVSAEVTKRLRGIGLPVKPGHGPKTTPHGTITADVLPRILVNRFGLDGKAARNFGVVVGGHHGVFPTSLAIRKVSVSAKGNQKWDDHRLFLVDQLAKVLGMPRDRLPHALDNATAMVFAGFVSVADWVGSNTKFFPYAIPLSAMTYTDDAKTRAREALDNLGWQLQPPQQNVRGFTELFPGIQKPNDLQRSVESLGADLNEPGLVIIEAPMGEGKTEAAIYLADHWAASAGQEGHYFALPTQATSNQMFGRVRDFLRGRYEGSQVQLQLLHGHASLSSEFQVLRENNNGVFAPQYSGVGEDAEQMGVAASEWFTHRKRGLLSPFGVGTIDQALLAVLQTKHSFVRLFGLAHKTVIIDEVHAYDAYMTTLLERLLEWLAALSSPVVLLSATLPRARREALLAAYMRGLGKESIEALSNAAYPRISWVSANSSTGFSDYASFSQRRQRDHIGLDRRLPSSPGRSAGSLGRASEGSVGAGRLRRRDLQHGGPRPGCLSRAQGLLPRNSR